EPVLLADVAQAATAEIEQYQRVTLNVQPGVAVSGHAVSDVVHLLAEVIENATVFSSKDTPVRMSAQQLANGGVLFEIGDSGVGVSQTRLAEMNHRLDHPPIIDESVGRHMGLFAVAHLAARHGVRVRLRPGSPRGLTVLVWLPENLVEHVTRTYAGAAQTAGDRADLFSGRTDRGHGITPGTGADGPLPGRRRTFPPAAPARAVVPQPAQAAGPPASSWFHSRPPSAPVTPGHDLSPSAPAQQTGGRGPARPGSWADQQHAAQIVSDPVRGDRTVAGMPVRVPRANLIRGSAGGGGRAGSGDSSRPAVGPETQTLAAAVPKRSPEMARSLLSGFQRGAGRPVPRDPGPGEGADR
ncbi:MAG TPA: ATP-binding protein, partial [Streptosporangiaceae bacterium]|nr:ATP-binding protein [Streptosporangiaceae bacterium]